MSGILELLREARRPERSVRLCLRGDLVSEFETVERDLQAALKKGDNSYGGNGDVRRLAARSQELQAQMDDASVTFRLRALGTLRSGEAVAEHPPRKEDDGDKRLGYNPQTLYPALVRECTYAIDRDEETLDPAEMSEEDWDALLGALSLNQFDRLFSAAWNLDHDDFEVPTSALASMISRRNDESLKQPGAGESAPEDSQGGSPSKSRRASTTKKVASSDQ